MPTPAERLKAGWTAHTVQTETRGQQEPRPYIFASQWHPCTRKMALDLLHPEDKDPYEPDTLERFARGNAIERSLVARLTLAGELGGWQVEAGQKRYEIRGRGGLGVVIVGKTDGVLRMSDGSRVPFDVKSGASVQHVRCLDDLWRGRWTRHMPYQLLAYMYGEGVEHGILILDQPSGPLFVEMSLSEHLDRMEAFLEAAEVAVMVYQNREDPNVWVAYERLPPQIGDPSECRKCDHYGKSCAPDIDYGPGLVMIIATHIVDAADIYCRTKEAAKEFADAKDKLKDSLRGCELGSIAGRFDVHGHWRRRGDNPQGSFIFDVEEVPDE